MSTQVKVIVGVLWLAAAAVPRSGFAQYERYFAASMSGAVRDSIAASGTATIRKTPTALRMYLQIRAKGATLEEALKDLKDRREAVTVELEGLKAEKDSISFSTPSTDRSQSQRQKQIEQMVRQQMSQLGRKLPKGLTAKPAVAVTVTLTAQWPLQAETPEEMILVAETLKSKIKAAEIAGKADEEVSAEQQELAEEMAGMASSFGDEEVQTDEPYFVYVAEVSKEEREQAAAAAFANARQQAAMLAKAAGIGLGKLVCLSGGAGGEGYNETEYFGGNYEQRAFLQQLMQRGAPQDEESTESTITGADPGKLVYRAYIGAMFALGEK